MKSSKLIFHLVYVVWCLPLHCCALLQIKFSQSNNDLYWGMCLCAQKIKPVSSILRLHLLMS